MQAQGEAAELVVEEALKNYFQLMKSVKLKVKGADCVLIVKKPSGRIVGKIILSQNAKQFSMIGSKN